MDAAIIECIHPAGEYNRSKGGKEYRGIRTARYTYVKDRNGPWLLFDNQTDPYQLNNLCDHSVYAKLQEELEQLLTQMLRQHKDEFLTGEHYIEKWEYETDQTGTVPYTQ